MQARSSAATVPRSASAPYLHLHVVLRGLSELLGRVMGLRLVPEQLGAGEGWAPGVLRMAVEHESLGRLGVRQPVMWHGSLLLVLLAHK